MNYNLCYWEGTGGGILVQGCSEQFNDLASLVVWVISSAVVCVGQA